MNAPEFGPADGHGFVFIVADGMQRWYGEYPSMYLSTAGLVHQVQAHARS